MTEQTARPEQPVTPPVPGAVPSVAEPPVAAEPPVGRKDHRVLRGLLRWAAAVAVFAAVGSATAYGITRMERTDVPGLATRTDGRWTYPELTMPALPTGSPRPFAQTNPAGAHYADLRHLVLPAPEGAEPDRALRGKDGWLATDEFLKEYRDTSEHGELRQLFVDFGLRHIAARGWTTSDGTHTRIYLLQFDTAAVVDDLRNRHLASYSGPAYAVRGTEGSVPDEKFPVQAVSDDLDLSVYEESEPYGAEQVRQAYLGAGDVLAVVLQSRKGVAAAVPFQQTVALQGRLLG
ncbi:hypothetical protein KVH22_35875 [Streptomyces olivaceus]|uniref:hypothetical protein n=1 Tax=Streptomyces olivaceus TaxID=47716 RepID=UPI001CCE4D78|nr:hypothetical protein [Streptomyces olivaceus]MBZ6139229.1 hypothetical protein [Streptomyces olivaceus]MBZ6167358.1 hypothetical protein [Streptomyces olivaceus]MBZ6260894.1 hypothetical protein [Streptomyces olivaceus]